MRRLIAPLAAAAATLAVGGLATAGPASAATIASPTACTPVSGGQAYLRGYGDTNAYVIAPGGTFSSPASPWTLSRAAVTGTEQATADVTGSRARGALAIAPGGRATAPEMCVAWNDDRVRFFYKAPANTSFQVTTVGRSSLGSATMRTRITSHGDGWQLTPAIPIPNWTDGSGTQRLSMTISNASGSAVTIDDVLVDPWKYTRW